MRSVYFLIPILSLVETVTFTLLAPMLATLLVVDKPHALSWMPFFTTTGVVCILFVSYLVAKLAGYVLLQIYLKNEYINLFSLFKAYLPVAVFCERSTESKIPKFLITDILQYSYSYKLCKISILNCIAPLIFLVSYIGYNLGYRISGICLGFVVFFYLIFYHYSKIQKEYSRKLNRLNFWRVAEFSQFVKKFRFYKIANNDSNFLGSTEKQIYNHAELNFVSTMINYVPRFTVESAILCALVLAVINVGNSADKSAVVTMLSATAAALYRLMPVLSTLIDSVSTIRMQTHMLDDVSDVTSHRDLSFKTDPSLFLKNFTQLLNSAKIRIIINQNQNARCNWYAIIGKSGSGKTTTIENLLAPDFRNQLSFAIPEATYVDQHGFAHAGVTLDAQLSYVNSKISAAIENNTVYRSYKDKPVQDFDGKLLVSGGEFKRINIIRGLLTAPKYLVIDEPEAGLDSDSLREIIDLIKESFVGEVCLFATHSNDVILECKTLIYID